MASDRKRSARTVPPWSSPREAVGLIVRGYTFHTSVRVAFVVGTILSLVNQGSVLVSGDRSAATVARIAINYLVPFLVASVGYLAPFRRTSEEGEG